MKRGRKGRTPELEGEGPDGLPYRVLRDSKQRTTYNVYFGIQTKQMTRITSSGIPTHEQIIKLLEAKVSAVEQASGGTGDVSASSSSSPPPSTSSSSSPPPPPPPLPSPSLSPSSLAAAAAAAEEEEEEEEGASESGEDRRQSTSRDDETVADGGKWAGALPSKRPSSAPLRLDPDGRAPRNYERERDSAYRNKMGEAKRKGEVRQLKRDNKRLHTQLADLQAQLDNAVGGGMDSVETFVEDTTKVAAQMSLTQPPSSSIEDETTPPHNQPSFSLRFFCRNSPSLTSRSRSCEAFCWISLCRRSRRNGKTSYRWRRNKMTRVGMRAMTREVMGVVMAAMRMGARMAARVVMRDVWRLAGGAPWTPTTRGGTAKPQTARWARLRREQVEVVAQRLRRRSARLVTRPRRPRTLRRLLCAWEA